MISSQEWEKLVSETRELEVAPSQESMERDLTRIPRVLAALEREWLRAPDLRLGQLVANLTRDDEGHLVSSGRIFLVEDSVLERRLEDLAAGRPMSGTIPTHLSHREWTLAHDRLLRAARRRQRAYEREVDVAREVARGAVAFSDSAEFHAACRELLSAESESESAAGELEDAAMGLPPERR